MNHVEHEIHVFLDDLVIVANLRADFLPALDCFQ